MLNLEQIYDEQLQQTIEDLIPTLEPEITGAPTLEDDAYEKYNEIVPVINKVANEMNFDSLILASIVLTESRGDTNAKRHETNRYNQIKSAFQANPKYEEHYNILKQKGLVQNEEEYFQIMSSYDRGLTQIAPATAVAYTSWRGHPDELYNPETNLRVIIEFLRNRGFNDESDAGLNGAIIANTIVNTNSRTGTTVEGHTERATGYWADLTNKAKIECHSPCTITFNNPIILYEKDLRGAILKKFVTAKINGDFSKIDNVEGTADEFRKFYVEFFSAQFIGKKIDAYRFYQALLNIGISSDESKKIVVRNIIKLYLRELPQDENVEAVVDSIVLNRVVLQSDANFINSLLKSNPGLLFKLVMLEIEKNNENNCNECVGFIELYDEEVNQFDSDLIVEFVTNLLDFLNKRKGTLFLGSSIFYGQNENSVNNVIDEINDFYLNLDAGLEVNKLKLELSRQVFTYRNVHIIHKPRTFRLGKIEDNDYNSDIIAHYIRRHVFLYADDDPRSDRTPFKGYSSFANSWPDGWNKLPLNQRELIIRDILQRLFVVLHGKKTISISRENEEIEVFTRNVNRQKLVLKAKKYNDEKIYALSFTPS